MYAARLLLVTALSTLVLLGCGGAPAAGPAAAPGSSSPSLATQEVPLGAGCVIDTDCGTDGFCDRTVPGGYCTRPCQTGGECGMLAACEMGMCLPLCTTADQCSGDLVCFEMESGAGVCAFDWRAVQPSAPNVGGPCRADIECAAPGALEPVCVPELNLQGVPTGHIGGMCTAIGCASDADCGEAGVCATDAPLGYCLHGCAGPADCRDGFDCDPVISACTPRETPSE